MLSLFVCLFVCLLVHHVHHVGGVVSLYLCFFALCFSLFIMVCVCLRVCFFLVSQESDGFVQEAA